MWGEIIKTSIYFKNQSLEPDPKTVYKRLNYQKPDLFHLKVLETRALVHIPKNI